MARERGTDLSVIFTNFRAADGGQMAAVARPSSRDEKMPFVFIWLRSE